MSSQIDHIIDGMFALFLIWLLHLLPIIIIGIPIWSSLHKKVKWNILDLSVTVIPFLVWSILMFQSVGRKGFGNLLEGLILGCTLPAAPVIRAFVRGRVNQVGLSTCLLIFLSFIAAGLYVFVPATIE